MAIPVLIMGESGTGKSTALQHIPKDDLALINVQGKPLPFRGQFDSVVTADFKAIEKMTLETKRPIVCVDDFGYTITDLYMRYSYGPEKLRDQYEVYKLIGSSAYNLINAIQRNNEGSNAEKIVFLTMHTDTDAQGHIVPATVGKMLNEKINLVGMFSVVLLSMTDGEHYEFVTNGMPPAKSPIGMFDSERIPNDLLAVDEAIRSYWNMAPIGGEK